MKLREENKLRNELEEQRVADMDGRLEYEPLNFILVH